MTTFILEVQKLFNSPKESKRFEHVGYMKKIFKSKKDAENYYNENNQHMQGINRYNTYCSDWDPLTKLRYIIRKDHKEHKTIPKFKEKKYIKSDFF